MTLLYLARRINPAHEPSEAAGRIHRITLCPTPPCLPLEAPRQLALGVRQAIAAEVRVKKPHAVLERDSGEWKAVELNQVTPP